MKLDRLEQILERTASRRITVIGDLMLDEFVWGKVGRISPEAPVPVVEVTGESFYPGGAANVARNLREFLDRVAVIGMLGKDRSGRQLRKLLAEQNIDTSSAIEDESFCTIVKTRIIALNQQVVRVDREKIFTPPSAQISMAVAAVRDSLEETDAIIFEDYGKGFVTTELVTQIARDAAEARKIVAADPNPRHSVAWRDADETPTKDMDLERVGKALLKKWETRYVLVTLGEHGMMLFQQNEPPHYTHTKA